MANHQPTPFRLSVTELLSLCERLRARAASTMFPDMPLLKTDLALAAEAIRVLMASMEPGDTVDLTNGEK